MDIAGQLLQIHIGINQYRLVTSLKKMTRPILTPIDPPGIPKREILQDSRKRDLPHLNGQVDMVTHKTEGMDAVAKALDPLLDQEAEASPVPVIEEYRLAVVAPQDGMVEGPRIVNSWLPSHTVILHIKLQ